MLRENLNKKWKFIANPVISVQSLAHTEQLTGVMVDLPHDAMIHESRSSEVPGKNGSGFYPGGSYFYEKTLYVPDEWRNQCVRLEFGGVYKNARVFINGQFAGGWQNGYTETMLDVDDFLNYGEDNHIRVMVSNQAQPSSRWYSGSGIYRSVNILRGGLTHIAADGVQIKTGYLDSELAQLNVRIPLVNKQHSRIRMTVSTEILDGNGCCISCDTLPMTMYPGSDEMLFRTLQVHQPETWGCETPTLYQYKVTLLQGDDALDVEEGTFGIRTIAMDSERGFLLNGQPIKLRGACIHHDNGLLGACAYADAEFRRAKLLKDAGFNCIRSAHNPTSREMLDACDRLGILVMDEYADMWTIPKNEFDDAFQIPEKWEEDLASLVRKDRNHPSVVMYCLGNEIPEAGTERGAWLCRKMNSEIKRLDDSRPTITSVSSMLACSSRLREIIMQIMADSGNRPQSAKQSDQSGMDGVSQANSVASLLHGSLGDAIWQHPIITEMLTPYKNATDMTGLNYMPSRYALEAQQHPDRLVLGTEDYPADIERLWELVEQYPHVIGDMTWTGYDYIGEAGIGIFYYDGTINFMPRWPDRLAYIGDIDITGNRRDISYYREIVYGLRHVPYIAVRRMDRGEQTPNQTAWMFRDTINSWTWHGYEGNTAAVYVYSDAPAVDLMLNGESLGIHACDHFTAEYQIPYIAGELTAYAIRNGIRAECSNLRTADRQIELSLEPEAEIFRADGLLYIPVSLKDVSGTLNMQERRLLQAEVSGVAVLKGFGSAEPSSEDRYDSGTAHTYDGRALIVIGAEQPGEAQVRVTSGDSLTAEIKIRVD